MDSPGGRDPFTEHCMYVMCGALTEEEVINYIERMLKDVEAEIAARNHFYTSGCRFTVNMPNTKTANYVPKYGNAHAFVWFTRKEVFYMLSGMDYDGESIFAGDASGPISDVLTSEWSEPVRVRKSYSPPSNVDGKDTPDFSPARAVRLEGEAGGTLFCVTALPGEITNGDLAEIFTQFATQGELDIARTAAGNAYITFTHPDDAYFALMMTKKYYFEPLKMMLDFTQSRFRSPPLKSAPRREGNRGRGRGKKCYRGR